MLYHVSGVWKDDRDVITHLNVHPVNIHENTFGTGAIRTVREAIRMLDQNDRISTMVWDYQRATWTVGAAVQVVGSGEHRYLRTVAGNGLSDNLDNLVNLSNVR